MDPNRWPPYSQQPYSHLTSGSPHLPLSSAQEDSLNTYGTNNSNSMLFSTSQNMQPHSSSRSYSSANHGPAMLPNSHYEPLTNPPSHPSKETSNFYNENIFNGVCRENQSRMHHFPRHRNEENGMAGSDNASRYLHPTPSSSHLNLDQPSLGPFGELPHQAIRHRVNRFDPSNETFLPPVSKQAAPSSFNNGPHNDREMTVYSSAPLSVQSAYSGDTSSLSPALNSVNSPSEYYSSPQNNYGAYSSLQSPAPNSPSVTQQSYPSSPYGNVDPNLTLPPCSPMNGGSYSVTRRTIQNHQHSPTSSGVMCYNTASHAQSSVHHGSQSMVLKNEYPPDYSGYTQERHSYSSVYPSMHSGQVSGGNSSRISSRTHSYSMPPDRRSRYGQPYPPSPAVSSPHYMQNDSHDVPYGTYSSSISPVQPMQPSRYRNSSAVNSYRTYSHHPTLVPVASNHYENYNSYGCSSSSVVDDSKTSDMYNSPLEPGANVQEQNNSFSNYDLGVLDSEILLTRQTRQPKGDECPLKQPVKLESANMTVNHRQSSEYDDPFPSYEPLNMRGPFHSPRRRGRRGRGRRGGRFPLSQRKYGTGRRGRRPRLAPVFDDYEYVESYPSHVYMEPESVAPMRLEYKQEIIDMEECYEPPCPRTIFEDRIGRPLSIEEELNFLLKLTFNHTSRRTRSNVRKDTDYQKRFLMFARKNSCDNYSSNPSSSELNIKEERKERDRIHLKISRRGREGGWWECRDVSASESASGYSILSSHEIKGEYDSKEKSKHTGKFSTLSEICTKHSAKRKNDNVDHDTYLDYEEKSNSLTNYHTLPAGKLKIKADKDPLSQNEQELTPSIPKKRGRKAKTPVTTEPPDSSKNAEDLESESVKNSDLSPNVKDDPSLIENDQMDNSNLEGDRLSSLRRRKGENLVLDPEPGPSQSIPIDEFEDEFDDNDEFNLDDSDSDPTWTGSVSKNADPLLKRDVTIQAPAAPVIPKKRGPKPGHKLSIKNSHSSGSPPPKKKKSTDPRKKDDERVVPSITIVRAKPSVKKEKVRKEQSKIDLPKKEKKRKEPTIKKIKKDKLPPPIDHFLIAKSDLDHATPYIWKIDKKTHMLQRFEVAEQNGVLIYQSSLTYAAWNEYSWAHYVSAKVEIISRTPLLYVVKFLGPDPTHPVENTFHSPAIKKPSTEMTPKETECVIDDDSSVEGNIEPKDEENFDHLKESFDIFLQSLISQAVDSSFLSEIHRENDEYFLNSIKDIESVTYSKKSKIVKDYWEEELKSSATTYPCINVLDSVMEHEHCQVCKKRKGVKLLQFYGQLYDSDTLCSIIKRLTNKTQFFVCTKCATTVSLYNRLHHQKYNFFIKCRTKMNEVRGNREKLESHTLLGDCLEDHVWVNLLFEELVQLWRESEKSS